MAERRSEGRGLAEGDGQRAEDGLSGKNEKTRCGNGSWEDREGGGREKKGRTKRGRERRERERARRKKMEEEREKERVEEERESESERRREGGRERLKLKNGGDDG